MRAHISCNDNKRQRDRKSSSRAACSELRAGLRVGQNAVGIVVYIGCNKTRFPSQQGTTSGSPKRFNMQVALFRVTSVSLNLFLGEHNRLMSDYRWFESSALPSDAITWSASITPTSLPALLSTGRARRFVFIEKFRTFCWCSSTDMR